MENPVAILTAITAQLAGARGSDGLPGARGGDGADGLEADGLSGRDFLGLPDDELLAVTTAAEQAGRLVDAVRVLCAGEIAERSRTELGKGGLAARKGCRNPAELVERLTYVAAETARKRIRLGRATRARLSLAGDRLPAEFPAVAGALAAGRLGVDGAHTIITGLTRVLVSAGREDVLAAEAGLVGAATGATGACQVVCVSVLVVGYRYWLIRSG
jgi:hypothetical protein